MGILVLLYRAPGNAFAPSSPPLPSCCLLPFWNILAACGEKRKRKIGGKGCTQAFPLLTEKKNSCGKGQGPTGEKENL